MSDPQPTLAEEVIDPEEFNRRQRFQQIHSARERVATFIADMDIGGTRGDLYRDDERKLAQLVAIYAHELLPLLNESATYQAGDVLDAFETPHDTLREFALTMGADGEEAVGVDTSMRVFAAINEFYAGIGMDLELSEGSDVAIGAVCRHRRPAAGR
jgi:hypothetical protein